MRVWRERVLVNDQRDAQIPFYVFVFVYNSLHVLIIRRDKLYQYNLWYMSLCVGKDLPFQPAHISVTNIEWLLPEAVLIQFVSPDDEHDVLETCREF